MSSPCAIEFTDVSFSYGRAPVLQAVDLTICPQETVCLVGPNGGGKSTFLKLALGLLEPQKGKVRLFGGAPRHQRRRVGYMPQHVNFDPHFPITVREIVAMGRLNGAGFGFRRKRDNVVIDAVLDQVELREFSACPFASLSGGQRQRVLIARALAVEPELLFLDEPTAMVDAENEARLLEKLRELHRKLTIVMVSHDTAFVTDLVETVVCVNRHVAVHPADSITHGMMHELYGTPVKMVRHDHHLESSCDGHE